MTTDEITTIIATLGIAALIFFAIRGIILWYYRINETIKLLWDIRNELRQSNGKPPIEEVDPKANPPLENTK